MSCANAWNKVEEVRRSPDAVDRAKRWIAEEQQGETDGNAHMEVQFNCMKRPIAGLADVLNLIDLATGFAAIEEPIAMGPAQDILDAGDMEFVDVLKRALEISPRFEQFTRGRRLAESFSRRALFSR